MTPIVFPITRIIRKYRLFVGTVFRAPHTPPTARPSTEEERARGSMLASRCFCPGKHFETLPDASINREQTRSIDCETPPPTETIACNYVKPLFNPLSRESSPREASHPTILYASRFDTCDSNGAACYLFGDKIRREKKEIRDVVNGGNRFGETSFWRNVRKSIYLIKCFVPNSLYRTMYIKRRKFGFKFVKNNCNNEILNLLFLYKLNK